MRRQTARKPSRLLSLLICMVLFISIMQGFSITAYANAGVYENSYNIHNALLYADTWTENGKELRNSKYGSFTGADGGDCTNFVSQCLIAAGLTEDKNWNSNSNWTIFGGYSDAYNTFVNVDKLRGYLASKGYATEVAVEYGENWIGGDALYPAAGDILQFDWGGDGIYDHSIICMGEDKDGILRFSWHSPPDAFNKRYDDIQSIRPATVTSGSFSGSNIILIHMTDTRGMQEVTSEFINKTITIKSTQVGQFVSADTADANAKTNAVANRNNAGTWELFTVEQGDYGAIGFRAANGNYLSARVDIDSRYAPVQAAYGSSYSKPQAWESFRIYKKGNDYYIQSQANGKWVQVVAENDANHTVKASAKEASSWERFQITEVSGSSGGSTQPSNPQQPSHPSQNSPTYVTNQRIGSVGDTYTGEWSSGAANGKGTYTWSKSGSFAGWWYEGYFKNGKMNGAGTLHTSAGGKYEGTFANDNFNGNVVYVDSSGAIYDETWENGNRKSSTPRKPSATVSINNFKVEQYALSSNPYIPGIRLTWGSDTSSTKKILFAPFIKELDSNGRVVDSHLANDGKQSGFEYVFVDIGKTYRVSVYAFIEGYHYDRADAIAKSNTATITIAKPNSSSNPSKPGNPVSGESGSVDKSAVFTRAYLGREATPSYTDEEVVFVEYLMTGYVSGEIWLNFSDKVTGERIYMFGPVPSWNKASLITRYFFTNGKTYQLYFTDIDGNSLSDSVIEFLYQPGSSAIFYPNDLVGGLPSYDTSGYNDYGDGDTRYKDYAYYELPDTIIGVTATKTINLFTGFGSGYDKLYIGDEQIPIDDFGTTPIVKDNRTLVPIRAVVENLGGTVEWDNNQRSVKCRLNGHYVQIWIDSATYYVDYFTGKTAEECRREFDVVPIIYNNRTMIPIRGVLEALGCTVDWVANGGGEGWNLVTVTSPVN